jgi:hypothetical protein
MLATCDDQGGMLPFLLGPAAKPLPMHSKLHTHLMPYLLEVCKLRGWGQQKLQLVSELCPANQYMGRKLYGSLISMYFNKEEEVGLRANMMDTSMKILDLKYKDYPISKEGLQLLECWHASGFPEI